MAGQDLNSGTRWETFDSRLVIDIFLHTFLEQVLAG